MWSILWSRPTLSFTNHETGDAGRGLWPTLSSFTPSLEHLVVYGPPFRLQTGKSEETGIQADPQDPHSPEHLLVYHSPFRLQTGKSEETGIQADPRDPPSLEHLMVYGPPFRPQTGKSEETGIQTDTQNTPAWSL